MKIGVDTNKCNLREILWQRRINHTGFAKKVGLSPSGLSALTNGHSIPNLRVAFRIARELNMNVDEIWNANEILSEDMFEGGTT